MILSQVEVEEALLGKDPDIAEDMQQVKQCEQAELSDIQQLLCLIKP